MESYETLTEAITALKAQGYTVDFNLLGNRLLCSEGKYHLTAEDFVIDKSFRFDVDENPSDQAVLYAISASGHNIKGLLVNGYGIYAENSANEILEKLKTHR
jgi:hypothetical protein